MAELNGYELSKAWFDWAFENPEKINPNHSAIYFFAIEHCNRLGWREKFGFPTQMAMDAVGIRKHQTFIRYFRDLVDWGFIKLIEPSRNQYSSNIISLKSAMPKNGKALGKAINKHAAKQGTSTGTSTGQSNSSIIKHLNNKPNNIEQVIEYFIQNGYSEDSARKAYAYYNDADWHDSKGKPVRNWKQKMNAVWFKPENKAKPKIDFDKYFAEYGDKPISELL